MNEAKHRLTVGLRLSKKDLEIEGELAPDGVVSVDTAPWIPSSQPHELARASKGSKLFLIDFPLTLRLSIMGFPTAENVSAPEMLRVFEKVQMFIEESHQIIEDYIANY